MTTLKPISVDHRDVKDKKIEFEGRTTANIELDGTEYPPEILITTKNKHLLLGLDWMGKLGITIESKKLNSNNNHINKTGNTADHDITTLKRKFHKLFNENHTINIVEEDIHLLEEAKLIQQNSRPIPIHLQPAVKKEIEKLKNQGYIEKKNNIDETCFVSPAVITIKKGKSLKKTLHSQKLNEITVKRKTQMPNMGKLISRITRKIADGTANEIWISQFDLDYAYGQLQLSKRAMDFCIFAVTGGTFTGYYRFLKGFYGLARHTNNF